MNDLIIIENGEIAPKTVEFIKAMESQKEAFNDEYDRFKTALLQAMEKNGVTKFEGKDVKVTYVAETTKETFDSKQFKADMPDLYNEYVKFSSVKPSVRIKVD